jgi:hypothetical protein
MHFLRDESLWQAESSSSSSSSNHGGSNTSSSGSGIGGSSFADSLGNSGSGGNGGRMIFQVSKFYQDPQKFLYFKELTQNLRQLSDSDILEENMFKFWGNIYHLMMIDTMLTFGVNQLLQLDDQIKKNAVYVIGSKEYSIADVQARCALYSKNSPENMLLLNTFCVTQPSLLQQQQQLLLGGGGGSGGGGLGWRPVQRLKRFSEKNFQRVRRSLIDFFTTSYINEEDGLYVLPRHFQSLLEVKGIKKLLGLNIPDEKITFESEHYQVVPSFECVLNDKMALKGRLHMLM